MNDFSEKVSLLIEDQLPEFIKSDHPQFVAFLRAYYEWLSDSEEGAVLFETKKLLDYSDIDRTSEQFLQFFKSKFLSFFPEEILADKSKLIKSIRDFYQKKGSQESLKFLFRVLYNQDIEILYPKENILKASDGKWKLPQSLRLTTSNTSPSFNINLINKRKAFGVDSTASCIIEKAYRTIDSGTNREIFELYVTNVNKLFENGENLEVSFIDDVTGEKIVLLSEKIIGSLSNIRIDPRNRGLKYRSGDPVVISGGLSQVDPEIQKAVAIVNNVTVGQVQTVSVRKGGYGFRIFANSIAEFINAPGDDQGVGAEARITAVDSDNAVSFNIFTDSIDTFSNVTISDDPFDSLIDTNFGSANVNTELSSAFTEKSINIAPIRTITVTSGGGGYLETPLIDIQSYYNSDLSGDFFPFIETNPILAASWEETRQNILDLGVIAAVEIINGGSGYDPATDTITIPQLGNGIDCQFDFTVDANGSITSVSVIEGGTGYRDTTVEIDSIAGSGAILQAFRYGEGQSVDVFVDDIGRIIDFRLISRGAGYIETPDVSLRIRDINIEDAGEGIGVITENDVVFQGDSLDLFTFFAKVDSYNVATNVLRVYDYAGLLSNTSNLRFQSFNVAIEQITPGVARFTTYGDGKAKARAEFLNGLILFNGFYLNTDGFLSADKRLQDSKKYHNFSYVVVAEKSIQSYREALLDILHPAGMSLLGYNQLLNTKKINFGVKSIVEYVLANTGLVTVEQESNAVVGFGTSFTTAKANDLIVIDSNSINRKQVKSIVSIETDTSLTIESDTSFIGDGVVRTESISNTVFLHSNSFPLRVSVGDRIDFSVNNEIESATVLSISGVTGNTYVLNIANTLFTTTDNNAYMVYPVYDNVSFKFISVEE